MPSNIQNLPSEDANRDKSEVQHPTEQEAADAGNTAPTDGTAVMADSEGLRSGVATKSHGSDAGLPRGRLQKVGIVHLRSHIGSLHKYW